MKKNLLGLIYSVALLIIVVIGGAFIEPVHAAFCGYYCTDCATAEYEQSISDCRTQRFGSSASCFMFCPF